MMRISFFFCSSGTTRAGPQYIPSLFIKCLPHRDTRYLYMSYGVLNERYQPINGSTITTAAAFTTIISHISFWKVMDKCWLWNKRQNGRRLYLYIYMLNQYNNIRYVRYDMYVHIRWNIRTKPLGAYYISRCLSSNT